MVIERACDPKKLRSTVTSSPPNSSCPPCFAPRPMRSARKISPAHVPHTAPPLAAKSRSGSKRFHRRQMFAIVVDCGSFRTSDDIGVEFRGVRSGVERRRGVSGIETSEGPWAERRAGRESP